MSDGHRKNERRHGQASDESAATVQPSVAPGKRTLTMGLPQRAPSARPVAQAPVQKSAGHSGVLQRKEQAGINEQWMDVAIRPDLYESPVQRKSAGTEQVGSAPLPASGSGQALPEAVQAKMEHAFGADFSAVRVHEGEDAPALGAQAYTQGTDIHFAPGHYAPQSPRGQELLGHELTHVVQQSQGRVPATRQAKGLGLNDDAGLEREADEMGARAARGESVAGVMRGSEGAHASQSVQRKPSASTVLQRFVPDDAEQADVTAALDSLLGPGNDPGGIRAVIVQKAAGLGELQAAVDRIVNQARVPEGDRVALLDQLGNDAELTARLLDAATHARGAGTPGVRLSRVLAANPGAPRTFNDLEPLLDQTQELDEKILRGRVTGGNPPPGARPTGEQRNLIGGHSPEIMNDEEFVIENDVHNLNDTHYISFRKLIRSDGGAAAISVRDSVANNPVDVAIEVADDANDAAINSTEPVNKVPDSLQQRNPAAYAKAIEAHNKKLLQWTNSVAAVNAAHGLVLDAATEAQHGANAAADHPTNAAQVKPFVDALTDMLNSAEALLRALKAIDEGLAAHLLARLNAVKDTFEQNGPVLSAKKNSTTAPAGWTDDDVLRAGDETSQETPTLIRQDATNNNPANGSQVETKHHKLIGAIVWVVIKEGVTIQKGPPPVFTGGSVISSYPTSLSAIPPDQVHPSKDEDRFSTIPV